jgi:uroporphyrinogen-III decarboxylase
LRDGYAFEHRVPVLIVPALVRIDPERSLMHNLMTEPNRRRFDAAAARIADAYRHAPTDRPPVVIQDANYFLMGEVPNAIPDDYFEEGAFSSQVNRQVAKIRAHLERFDDDYIPFLFPWYGTGVVPSALGCSILFQPKEEPAVEVPVVTSPEQVKRLVPPDPYRDGLMPRVLRCIDYMRANSDLPVSFTDNQGPFNIALNLVGVNAIMLWMYDHPTVVHELMDFCTTVLIDWVRVQKEHAGQTMDGGAFPHFVSLPAGRGGVWISDDDCTIMSPALYREFVVPYNSRVFQAFGGGTLHYCGTATHQLENFLATDGLIGINNWSQGDFRAVFRAQDAYAGRLVLVVDDFAPLDIDGYYAELFAGLRGTGTIVGSFPSATSATDHGRTVAAFRDPDRVACDAYRAINRELGAVATR